MHSGARGRRSKIFSAGLDKTISRAFCVRPYFIFIHTYVRFFVFFARQHSSHALLLSEHRRQTQTTTAAMLRAYFNQLATMLHGVLYCSQSVVFIGPWDPSSRIVLRPVSYDVLSAVCDRRRQPPQPVSDVLLLYFALLLL